MHTGTFCIDYNARIALANTNYITSKKEIFFLIFYIINSRACIRTFRIYTNINILYNHINH